MSPTAIFIHKLQLEINFIFKVSISINSSWTGKKFELKAIQASGRIRIPWACQTTQVVATISMQLRYGGVNVCTHNFDEIQVTFQAGGIR